MKIKKIYVVIFLIFFTLVNLLILLERRKLNTNFFTNFKSISMIFERSAISLSPINIENQKFVYKNYYLLQEPIPSFEPKEITAVNLTSSEFTTLAFTLYPYRLVAGNFENIRNKYFIMKIMSPDELRKIEKLCNKQFFKESYTASFPFYLKNECI